MKHVITLISILAISLSTTLAQQNILTEIENIRDANGNSIVTINQDPQITRLIHDKVNGINRQTSEIQGYRVQVYSSSVPRTAKSEAFKVEKKFNENIPQLNSYVIFQPPFWKVRLGDFRTQNEAIEVRDEIRNKYPDIQGDVYVVPDNIQIVE